MRRRRRKDAAGAGLPLIAVLAAIAAAASLLPLGADAAGSAAAAGAGAAALLAPSQTGYYCDPSDGRACCPASGGSPLRRPPVNCPPCTAGGRGAPPPLPPSPLWGCRGELAPQQQRRTNTTSAYPRLGDWSYAGYGAGGADLPPGHEDLQSGPAGASANIRRRYGARGDGLSDDTPAFERFLRDVKTRAVLRIPAGRYVITRPLTITSNVVLRGDGRERTFLVFPSCPGGGRGGASGGGSGRGRNGSSSSRSSRSSSSRAAVRARDFRGDYFLSFASYDEIADASRLARVTVLAPQGASALQVDDVSRLKKGQWVRLVLDSPAGDTSLGVELSGGLAPGGGGPNGPPKGGMRGAVRFSTFVTGVEEFPGGGRAGGARPGRVSLGRPLPLAVASLAWRPSLHPSWSSWRRLAGVEGLTLEFPPGRDYAGPDDPASGCNGVGVAGTQHAFVRGVDVTDADAAVAVLDSAFVSVEDVRVRSTRPRRNVRSAVTSSSSSSAQPPAPLDGAYGVRVINSQDVLVRRVEVAGRYGADVAVQGAASLGTAVASARGADLAVALSGARGTLLTDVDFGAGTRPWGGAGQGRAALGGGPAAGTVVWNARAGGSADGRVPAPPPDYAPLATVVGVALRPAPARDSARVGEARRAALGWYYEPPPATTPAGAASSSAAGAAVPPLNLLDSQRALRSAAAAAASAGGGPAASSDRTALAVAPPAPRPGRESGALPSPSAFSVAAGAASPAAAPSPPAAAAATSSAQQRQQRQPRSPQAKAPSDGDGAPYYCEGAEGRPCGCAEGSDERVRVAYAASLPNAASGLRLSPSCGACAEPRRSRARPSRLYGCHGELWAAKGRLPDFSYAGFRAGDYTPGAALAFASKPVVRSLRAYYGAVGDGVADDTPAFERAEADLTLQDAVLYLPAGKYVLKKPIAFRRPGLVIRGAGREATTIYIPASLTDALGNAFREGGREGTSDWSHKGAFLTLSSWDPSVKENLAARIARPALRGDTRLYVTPGGGGGGAGPALVPGRWVRLVMDADNAALLADMSGGYFAPGRGQLNETRVARHLSRVRAVDPAGAFVELERPLVHNVSLAWAPRLHLFSPQRNGSETGFEDLTVEFPWTPYPGHFKEQGYNAIHLNQNHNSWVRNVRILNSDSAIYLWGTAFCSVSDVVLATWPKPRGTRGLGGGREADGHRGIWLEYGESNLIERFRVEGRFLHDLSVSAYESNSVFSSGYGDDLNIDFHRASPYANLFTDLDHGAGSRQTESGGDEVRGGAHAAAFNTIWNAKGRLRFYYDTSSDLGPLFNFVAYRTNDSFPVGWRGWWEERLRPRPFPGNLYESMRATRKSRLSLP